MTNKKGFTLIELLAVIVILSIIALIAFPIILGVIDKAEYGAAKQSALGYLDAIEKQAMTNTVNNEKLISDGSYNISTLTTDKNVNTKGEKPTDDSWVVVEKGQVVKCSLKINDYIANCNNSVDRVEVNKGADVDIFIETISLTSEKIDSEKPNNLNQGETLTLKLNTTPALPKTAKILYKSNDPSIATISDTGVVTGVSVGKTIVSASVSNKTVEIEVTVDPKVYKLSEIVYFDPVSENLCDSTTFNVAKVKAGTSTCYKWRVVTMNDAPDKTHINIMLDHNLGNTCTWGEENAIVDAGPTVAFSTLENATKTWTRVHLLDYSYDGRVYAYNYQGGYQVTCTSGVCKINATGAVLTTNMRVRMLEAEELKAMTGNTTWYRWTNNEYSPIFYISNTQYVTGTRDKGAGDNKLKWLVENTSSKSIPSNGVLYSGATDDIYEVTNSVYGSRNGGYWTMTPGSNAVWHNSSIMVAHEGSASNNNIEISDRFGVRPVIKIEKLLLK